MAFIADGSTTISFADMNDVQSVDQRLFDNNESLTDEFVEDALIRTTGRILDRIRNTNWWLDLYSERNSNVTSRIDIPRPNPDRIKAREDDFTDLCVYEAMADRILPAVADFGEPDNSERQKMGYYKNRADSLFLELVNAGDWYDFDGDSSIATVEKKAGRVTLKRVR